VITLAIHLQEVTREGWSAAETCQRLEDGGADVVGLNCIRGPCTMLPLLQEIRGQVKGPVAGLPVPYRTHDQEPTFQSLRDPERLADQHGLPFPTALDPFTCTRDEMADFAREAFDMGVNYLGVCCGAGPHHVRGMAEALGRTPAASRYSADMSQHAFLGSDPTLKEANLEYAKEL